jgi:hypothetical protein
MRLDDNATRLRLQSGAADLAVEVGLGHDRPVRDLRAREVSGWPKRCKLARAFLWGYSYKRLKLAQLLGQLGVFLTLPL